jgi:uncharacterized protein DUF6111
MLRVFFTIVIPLALPTALYLLWLRMLQWSRHGTPHGEGMRWAALPWLWLAATGVVLLAMVLYVVSVHFGTATPGVYVPPRWENGRIVPGHIEPRHTP